MQIYLSRLSAFSLLLLLILFHSLSLRFFFLPQITATTHSSFSLLSLLTLFRLPSLPFFLLPQFTLTIQYTFFFLYSCAFISLLFVSLSVSFPSPLLNFRARKYLFISPSSLTAFPSSSCHTLSSQRFPFLFFPLFIAPSLSTGNISVYSLLFHPSSCLTPSSLCCPSVAMF